MKRGNLIFNELEGCFFDISVNIENTSQLMSYSSVFPQNKRRVTVKGIL